MVASQQSNAVRVLHLQAEQVLESLDRVVTSIHEVTDEDVASLFDVAAWIEPEVPVLNS